LSIASEATPPVAPLTATGPADGVQPFACIASIASAAV
jgi:hypothetical protein